VVHLEIHLKHLKYVWKQGGSNEISLQLLGADAGVMLNFISYILSICTLTFRSWRIRKKYYRETNEVYLFHSIHVFFNFILCEKDLKNVFRF